MIECQSLKGEVTLSSTKLEQALGTTFGFNKSTEVQQELWLPICLSSSPLYPAHKFKYTKRIINNIKQFNRNQPKQCKPSGYSEDQLLWLHYNRNTVEIISGFPKEKDTTKTGFLANKSR